MLPYGAKKGLAERSGASIMRPQEGRPISFRGRDPIGKWKSRDGCGMSWEGGCSCIRGRALITISKVEEKGRKGLQALGELKR